jgi:hypothetical protein
MCHFTEKNVYMHFVPIQIYELQTTSHVNNKRHILGFKYSFEMLYTK